MTVSEGAMRERRLTKLCVLEMDMQAYAKIQAYFGFSKELSISFPFLKAQNFLINQIKAMDSDLSLIFVFLLCVHSD